MLHQIIERRSDDLGDISEGVLRYRDLLTPAEHRFSKALRRPGVRLILEVKKASPSQGLLRDRFHLEEIASVYGRYADAISVITEPNYFQGDSFNLSRLAAKVQQPLLCKDFFIHPDQVDWARLLGAEAVLLMLSVLDDESYGALRARARTLGMDVLTEVHTEQELSRALSLDADIIGVNNRDLTTLKVDTNQVLRLAPHVPKDRLVVAESGYHTRAQLREAAPYVHAFLVGSALMAQDHLENAVRDLMVGRVKVCGLTRKQDAQMARDLGATYGGLIAVPDSPRFVDPEQAKSLQIPGLDWVVVARNASFEQLSPYWAHGAVTAIQFHDDQTQDELIHWRRRLPKDIAIWKALPVDVQSTTLPNDVLQWLNPESPADVLVLDSQSGDHFGGTGQTFNWQLLQGLPSGKQVMLAGGLTPLNIGEAPVHPRLGYDVSSGVEQAAGVKSPIAMRRFFDRLKGR